MIKVQKILPKGTIDKIIMSVNNQDLRSLTHLRSLLENNDVPPNDLLLNTLLLKQNGCICTNTVYVIAGVAFQHGARLTKCSFDNLCLSQDEEEENNIKMNLRFMDDIQVRRGICPLDSVVRNWLASMCNRNDKWEGGIVPVPMIYMKDIPDSIYRSVSMGSYNYYEGMIFYAKHLDCSILTKMLKEIVRAGIDCMDFFPIRYAIQEGGEEIKNFTIKILETVTPKDECAREGLIKLANLITTTL